MKGHLIWTTFLIFWSHSDLLAGLSGRMVLDTNGDRIADYRIWHLPVGGNAYEPLLVVSLTKVYDRNASNTQVDRVWKACRRASSYQFISVISFAYSLYVATGFMWRLLFSESIARFNVSCQNIKTRISPSHNNRSVITTGLVNSALLFTENQMYLIAL